MQQLDLKNVCATDDLDIPDSTVVEVPSESFWLSKDAEFDWFAENAFLERKESTKGNFNSMGLSQSVNPSHSNPSSQRYSVSLKPKAPIIGLPKTQKTTYVDLKCRQCKPLNVRLFPKKMYSFAVRATEPSSPKVSCIGRVRSKSRRNLAEQAVEPVKSACQRSGTGRAHKAGLMSRILSLFGFQDHRRKNSETTSGKEKKLGERSGSRRTWVSVKPVNSEPGMPFEPDALGGMIRFASGRRSDYLGGLETDDVAGRHSLGSKVGPTR
ncbi:putative calcium/calmodulin-dependent protein kinase [Helianthus annuus]|uniref:Calcium/calmodulin-dependent protein kinase n=1 Tax=Helianthus annuus TaxID=4232 RepID=A0A251UY43_HELAN|nr:uncharacterized protein LOC110936634 [Helianthus annuus]KAF5809761.1 putative calcium/calmodulin-dependent protein kinase [Helianthus annuus]KAJ0580729.1 putative calcium/calmodulin-dependent protein kinase [Helianthus annuus]KAJ0588398.1 putative calcium/calmodulin-dependent protein kinase [Helianthus annuus]KAJ0596679.1 putative calcium/calmodulin-dependent protein kinase [Helianthus annuus]KAJ0757346.1 putative calcium/calmodulin-dependent protein kinase [Helianthus annuus]